MAITSIPTDFLELYRTVTEMDTAEDFIASLERLRSGVIEHAQLSDSGSDRKPGINRALGRLAHNIDAMGERDSERV